MRGDNLGPLPMVLMCELEIYALVPVNNLSYHISLRNNQRTLIVFSFKNRHVFSFINNFSVCVQF